ncbi:MAG: CHAD domain-containing protein [Roseofilum sp. SBFL]|uniref:CHAD domain-containing protein n=1 Tax=unclassified Roseofilum TaxID=2620099 RepID=UPI001AFD4EFE|nr:MULTISPECIES: CHAD domain-containing protein [unclassified Roseofilum]MBP0013292.1 CHAD domain-containing protein [Roseofilum sp. SID3]MBP0025875.1 CHAD domain-containing protein [Roseofilum sp. SID2]MBP0038418.1 CHAD domain-containing protein [Roseofilum sp. SID1]MBP0044543.1 CHAD domain-containing protein [Roseofilum sp. SBFL]
MIQQRHSQTQQLRDWAYLGMEKYFRKAISYEQKVLADQDPEDLHQMRVGMRRLRSAVTGFAPILDLPPQMSNKRIGKMARILGELRDLDVLQEALQEYQPQVKAKEQPLLEKALQKLSKQRSKAFKTVKNFLKGKTYKNFKQSVNTWLQEPHYQNWAELPVNSVLPDLLLPYINQLLLHPAWWVGVTVEGEKIKRQTRLTLKGAEAQISQQGEALHDLRKQAKRVRYQMSLFRQHYGPVYQEYVQEIKQIQEVLGTIQDTLVLEAFLDEVLPSNWRQEGTGLTKLLTKQRYECWKEWYKLQQRYLNELVRQGLRQAAISPLIAIAVTENNTLVSKDLPEDMNSSKTTNHRHLHNKH